MCCNIGNPKPLLRTVKAVNISLETLDEEKTLSFAIEVQSVNSQKTDVTIIFLVFKSLP